MKQRDSLDRFQITEEDVARFIACVPVGQKNAIRTRTLAPMLGYRYGTKAQHAGRNGGGEVIRALSRRALEDGVLIVASGKGYYKPATREEALVALKRVRGTAHTVARRVALIEHVIAEAYSEAA